jgi:hypothetical protein
MLSTAQAFLQLLDHQHVGLIDYHSWWFGQVNSQLVTQTYHSLAWRARWPVPDGVRQVHGNAHIAVCRPSDTLHARTAQAL